MPRTRRRSTRGLWSRRSLPRWSAGAGEVLIDAEVADALLEHGRLVGVVTADGREHRADRVVLATGAWSGTSPWLPPEARPPVRPVKGQILTLRGAPDSRPCERIVASERVYVVPRRMAGWSSGRPWRSVASTSR